MRRGGSEVSNFFSLEGKFFQIADKFGNLFLLNFLCFLCCLPIVTIGASLTACYYVTLRMARNEEQYIARDFLRSFRRNFRQGTLIGFTLTIVCAVLFLGIKLLAVTDGAGNHLIPLSGLFLVIDGIAVILTAMEAAYVFPLLAKFDNSTRNMMKNALQISFHHIPKTLLILTINAITPAVLLIALLLEDALWLLSFFLCFGISGPAFLCSIFLVRIFDQYINDSENCA